MHITDIQAFTLADRSPDPDAGDIEELSVLEISTDEGLTGIAELFYVPAGVARAVVGGCASFFGRLLIGEDPFPPERLWQRLYGSMTHGARRGWAIMALGAIDVALWDIAGKLLNRPTYQLLGGTERAAAQVIDGTPRDSVTPYCTIVSHDWDHASVLRQQLERISLLCECGYKAFKIEPMNSAPTTIIELARQTRHLIGPNRMLAVDVGYLWNDVGQALDVVERLREFDIFFLETPFPTDAIAAYARLAAHTPLRIAMGEHTVTRWEFLDFMDRGGVSVVQPYMTTVGGLTEARRLLDLALPRGLLVCPGNWSTGILHAATVQFAAYSPTTPYFEFAPAEAYPSPLRQALQAASLPPRDGVVPLPQLPGNGFTLPPDLVAHFRK